jgi:hypothetical protein
MGLMTELFVAREDDAKMYDHTTAGRVQSVKLGGLTNLEFETLWAILLTEEWSLKTHALEQVASSKETWIFKFPQAYVDKLRSLDPPGVSRAANSWAATEELSCNPPKLNLSSRSSCRSHDPLMIATLVCSCGLLCKDYAQQYVV